MGAKIILLAVFIAANFIAFSQAPVIEWQKCLGGTGPDYAFSIAATADGGYMVAGMISSNDSDVTGYHGGNSDCWVVKLNSMGNMEWQKTFGGSKDEDILSIIQTIDGGYAFAGESRSDDADVSGHHGSSVYSDYWVVKIDSVGTIQWQKSLGGSSHDFATSIIQTTDDGFVVAGWAESDDGDITGHHGPNYAPDYWIVKLDVQGNMQWEKSIGGSYGDYAESIKQTKDGGYAIAGYSGSSDGDVTGNHGSWDQWIVKIDSLGGLLWEKSFGGSGDDEAYSIVETSDGGYAVAGNSNSADGDVTNNQGEWDYWVIKIDSDQNLQWQKSFGGSRYDAASSIFQTSDKGFAVAGYSFSNDGDVSNHHGSTDTSDVWVVKLDSILGVQWQKSFGGSKADVGYAIVETNDSTYAIAGNTASNDGDVSGNKGENDYWVVKLAFPTLIGTEPGNLSISIFPNPSTGIFELRSPQSEVQNLTAFNLLGEKVFSTTSTQHSNAIDLSSQPDGVYFLHFKTAEGMVIRKVVISR